jgi:hypothetical protein
MVIHLLSFGTAAGILDRRGETALSTETSLAARGAARLPSWLEHRPWVPKFKAVMEHHSGAPFPANALVAAAAVAAKPYRRRHIETPDELQNQREVVEQLLLAAVQHGTVAAHAALKQHWPESRQLCW